MSSRQVNLGKTRLFLKGPPGGDVMQAVTCSVLLTGRERAVLRRLGELETRWQLCVNEELHGGIEARYCALDELVWPIGSPDPARDVTSEEQGWRELAGTAPGLVIAKSLGGAGMLLRRAFLQKGRRKSNVIEGDFGKKSAPTAASAASSEDPPSGAA